MGYTMTADEVAFWQDQAALLDPLAYEYVTGSGATRTVPTGETWYLINAWNANATAGRFFHRSLDVRRAWPMSEGTSLVLSAQAGANLYICKPSLVTGSDARYTTDPRGLYFDRMRALGELAQYQLALAITDGSNQTATFPADFDYGMVVQVSVMDVAWVILRSQDTVSGLNTLPEVSDTHQNRYAEACIAPFERAEFTKMESRGVSLGDGAGVLWYVKLPGGW